jgi:hypothetical protein
MSADIVRSPRFAGVPCAIIVELLETQSEKHNVFVLFRTPLI